VRTAALGWVLLLADGAVSAQDVLTFTSATEVVRVDVSVVRDGKPLEGLTASDFEVRDNGVLQSLEIVGDAGKHVDAVLALDVSSSVAGEPLRQLKAAAHAFVDVLRPEDRLSLLTFSSRVQLVVSPEDSRERAHQVIDATQAQLTTALHDAAYAAVVTADPTRGRPLALIFSDGEDHGSWLKPEQVLRAAEASELVVHAVVSRRVDTEMAFLSELVVTTGGEEWRADFGELREALLSALEEFRSRYTLRYERTGVFPAEWHELEVRVRRPGVQVRARRGYVELDDLPGGRP
jgi:Ca-activated chloride channel homolog